MLDFGKYKKSMARFLRHDLLPPPPWPGDVLTPCARKAIVLRLQLDRTMGAARKRFAAWPIVGVMATASILLGIIGAGAEAVACGRRVCA